MLGKHLINTATRAVFTGVAVAGAFVSTSASASIHTVLFHPTVATMAVQETCAANAPLQMPATRAVPKSVGASKSMAILGGEMSALERMKAEQSGQQVEMAEANHGESAQWLQPAAGGARSFAGNCLPIGSQFAVEATVPRVQRLASSDFLASRRIGIRKTVFEADWNRVTREALANPGLYGFGGVQHDRFATLKAVNSWVNKRIAYVEDHVLFGQADYWAGANTTLSLRMGDCEDIAVTKMQLLAAAGFREEDMFLTIAKDTIRKMDHALLVVRVEDRFVVLDNTTDTLLDGARAHDYRPVLSFSGQRRWVHGY